MLEARNIGKRFGGLEALTDVTLTIERGEIYGLIGPNGAGKTTFFNVLTGFYPADGGEFVFDGAPLNAGAAHAVAAAGIARTFQNIRLFGNMTALENVMVGRHVRTRAGVLGAVLRTRQTREEERAIHARAHALLEYVGIASRQHDLAHNLPYGDQRRLEIARALATEPKLLALDEPAAGMNATETATLKRAARTHPRRWHDDTADRARREAGDGIVRPRRGTRLRQENRRRRAGRRATRSRRHRSVSRRRHCIIHRTANRVPRRRPALTPAATLLSVQGLKVAYGGINAVKGIDFSVNAGEMVTLIGANGAGKTTTLKALTGLVRPVAGRVRYNGADITALPSHRLVALGIALVPEGRGVFPRLTVEENIDMGAYCRDDKREIRADRDHVFALFPRLAERRRQVAGTLSGGEQQMLAIGRAIMGRPRLLLLDEPSMGLAPLMVQKIFATIRAIAATGVTTLLVEQNARLALEMCDRGYVMESGEITLHDEARALLANPQVRRAYLGE